MLGAEHWLGRLRLRLRSLTSRSEVEGDLQDEMAFHLAMQAEANGRAGMAAREAQLAALGQFGGVAQQREACRDHIFGSSSPGGAICGTRLALWAAPAASA
jgi:hypothetical protein